MANTSEILKDKRVIIGGSVAGLLLIGGVVAVMTGALGGGTPPDDTPPVPTPPVASGGAPAGSVAPTSATPPIGAVTGKQGAPKAAGSPAATVAPAPRRVDDYSSFAEAPPTYGGGAGAPPAGGGAPVPSPVPGPPTGGGKVDGKVADATPTNTAKAPFAPLIQAGVQAPGFRKDPFVSFRFPAVSRPAAYFFLAPLRLASRPQPPTPPPSGNPDIDFGPLPYVPRRVAGILHNGSVSAILETGADGLGNVNIVQPGDRVDSGIAGLDQLTVSAITATQVTLRADDGRTVSVPLTGSAAAAAAAAAGQGGGTGGPGGPGGPPPPTRGGNGGPAGLQ